MTTESFLKAELKQGEKSDQLQSKLIDNCK